MAFSGYLHASNLSMGYTIPIVSLVPPGFVGCFDWLSLIDTHAAFQRFKEDVTSLLVVPAEYMSASVVMAIVGRRHSRLVLVTNSVALSILKSHGIQRTEFDGCYSRIQQVPCPL
jgi:hypothetical protein